MQKGKTIHETRDPIFANAGFTVAEYREYLKKERLTDIRPALVKFAPESVSKCHLCGCSEVSEYLLFLDGDRGNILPSNVAAVCDKCMDTEIVSKTPPTARISVCKEMSFAAAHRLPAHKGKCCNWHGHEWKVEVTIKDYVNPESGMVMDFSILKNAMEKCVISLLDHGVVNDHLRTPTAENLLVFIWERLMFGAGIKGIEEIMIWESPDSRASLKMADMLRLVTP